MGPVAAITDQTALVSPGLKYLAFWVLDDNATPWIQVRDLATGKPLSRIKADPGVLALAYSADDQTLAWHQMEKGNIFLSDVKTGRELRRLRTAGQSDSATSGDGALAIAFSADGRSLAVSWMSHAIELWDLPSGKQTLPLGKSPSALFEQQSTDWWNLLLRPALAFSPDGKKLVGSLGGATVRQFRVDRGAEIPGPDAGPRAPAATLALAPGGKSLWSYGPGDPARRWDWMTGKKTGQHAVPAVATHAVFAADGRYGFAADHYFTFCDTVGTKSWKVAGPNSQLVSLALSPDGALLATRNFMRPEVHMWDVATGKERLTVGRAPEVPGGDVAETAGVLPLDLVFSPDGRFLAAGGPDRQLCLWDSATGKLLWEAFPQAAERFAFSPDGRTLACLNADHTVTLYEIASHAERSRFGEADPKRRRVYLTDGSRSPLFEGQMRRDAPVCLTFSPDGRYLATAQETPAIHLWDLLTGRAVGALQAPEGGVVALLFAPDGRHLISAGTDTTALTWDLTGLTRRKPPAAARLEPQALDALWADLGSKDAGRAFAAVRQLSLAPGPAVSLLRDRLRPAVEAPPDQLRPLLVALGSPQFRQRQAAMSQLAALGERAGPALRAALKVNRPVEERRRITQLLGALDTAASGEILCSLRAVEVLEQVGGSEARQVLEALAAGMPSARMTREARGALQRLGQRVVPP
jgi:WD40 repeat protein